MRLIRGGAGGKKERVVCLNACLTFSLCENLNHLKSGGKNPVDFQYRFCNLDDC